jgi:hypothetical protein
MQTEFNIFESDKFLQYRDNCFITMVNINEEKIEFESFASQIIKGNKSEGIENNRLILHNLNINR